MASTDDNKYGTLLNRLKAILIDGIVIMGLALIASEILSDYENASGLIRVLVFILILLYDPFFTSFFGATVGHLFIGLKVRRESDETKKIKFSLAIVRFMVKAFLGWISLLSVSSDTKRKALHDSLIGSVVLKADF